MVYEGGGTGKYERKGTLARIEKEIERYIKKRKCEKIGVRRYILGHTSFKGPTVGTYALEGCSLSIDIKEGVAVAIVSVTIRMDENLKKQASELFSESGLSFGSAVRLFAQKTVEEGRIPFEIARGNDSSAKISLASDDDVREISKQLIEQNMVAYKELAK